MSPDILDHVHMACSAMFTWPLASADGTPDCVYQQWFLEVFLGPFSNVKDRIMLMSDLVSSEGLKTTASNKALQPCPLKIILHNQHTKQGTESVIFYILVYFIKDLTIIHVHLCLNIVFILLKSVIMWNKFTLCSTNKKILTISVQIYTLRFIWQAHYQKENLTYEW